MHTNSYNTQAKYIVHACGPRWDDYRETEKIHCYDDLKRCFYNTLIYSETKLKPSKSICIPLLSSGIFGVPRNLCCKALFKAIKEYLDEAPSDHHIKLIKLCNIDKETNTDLVNYFRKSLNTSDAKVSTVKGLDKGLNITEQEYGNKCVVCETLGDSKSFRVLDCKCSYCPDCFENCEQNNLKCVNDNCFKEKKIKSRV